MSTLPVIWVLLVVDPDGEWDIEYAAATRDEIEQHEADVLREDPDARTLVKEYALVLGGSSPGGGRG